MEKGDASEEGLTQGTAGNKLISIVSLQIIARLNLEMISRTAPNVNPTLESHRRRPLRSRVSRSENRPPLSSRRTRQRYRAHTSSFCYFENVMHHEPFSLQLT